MIDRRSGIPLYVQVREGIREALAPMEPGQVIPTETELEARFGVSRITVRKAIDDLVAEGLLVRRQGRGTFVQRPKLTHELNAITSWTEQLLALGYTPRTSNAEIDEMEPPKRIARLLRLEEGERVVRLRRLRLANEEPMSLMVNYVTARLVPGLAENLADHESLYEALEQHYNLVAAMAEDTVETREATEYEAELLKIQPWSPVLCVTRVGYRDDDTPFEVAVVSSRGDRYQYRVTLRGRTRTGAEIGALSLMQGRKP